MTDETRGRSPRLTGMIAFVLALPGACALFDQPHQYDRHRLSDITLPRDPDSKDSFYFDVTIAAEFPEHDAQAEATRMQWLSEWLKQRHMCPQGHEIVQRRRFEFLEHNPAHRDLRYEVRCLGS